MEEWIRRRRERAQEGPIRRQILALLAERAMSLRELREGLQRDLTLAEVNRHLVELQAADLVWGENGRYWLVPR